MMRAASLAAAAAIVVASPAHAQERTAAFDLPAGSLRQSLGILSRQAGVSIGLRDPSFGKRQVRAVRGRMSTVQALDQLLSGTALRARMVARGAYLLDAAPERAQIVRAARKEAPAPAAVSRIRASSARRRPPWASTGATAG